MSSIVSLSTDLWRPPLVMVPEQMVTVASVGLAESAKRPELELVHDTCVGHRLCLERARKADPNAFPPNVDASNSGETQKK